MIKGWKKLSKAQLKHLKDHGCNNTALFQRTIDEQARQRHVNKAKIDLYGPDAYFEPCYECSQIARVLEMKAKEY